ncbi:MAG: hypothetical protein Q7V88_01905, partial [Actinomycetota bacterium]|nr:hypothetical protein [Actinomycetota bacterium]
AATLLVLAGCSSDGPAATPTTVDSGFTTGNTLFTPEKVIDLQARCIYLADQEACDTLEQGLGLGPDGNYGLGNSLTQAPDEAASQACVDGDPLYCLEISSRYPAAEGDEAAAGTFVTGISTNDAAMAAPAAAPYVLGQFGAFQGAGSFEAADYLYDPATGLLQFDLQSPAYAICHVGQGLVRTCTVYTS